MLIGHIGIFPKGVTQDFGQKLKKVLLDLLVDQMHLEIMFDDHPVKNRDLPDYKRAPFVNGPYWNFSKGGNP